MELQLNRSAVAEAALEERGALVMEPGPFYIRLGEACTARPFLSVYQAFAELDLRMDFDIQLLQAIESLSLSGSG